MKLPDGWKKVKLKQLAHIDKKSLGSKTSRNYVFRYISLSDVDHGHIKHDLPVIKFSDSPSRARRVVSKGDVLFSSVRPNLEGYCRITESANDLIASTGFAVITPKTNTDTEYIYQYLYSHDIKRQIYALVVGSNYPAVNNSDISSLKFIIPDDPAERKAIANLLSSWDKAIEKTERLIQVKEKRFKGYAQRLIDQRCTEWTHIKPKKIFDTITEKNFPDEELLSVTQNWGVIPRSMLEGRVMSPNGTTASYKLIKSGDFVISLRSFQGGVEYSNYQGIISPAYTVLRPKIDINSEFYRHFFKTYIFIEKYLNLAVIGIRDGKQISIPDFMSIKIPVPLLEEQKQIAETLSTAQQEIDLFKQLAEKYKTQKRGLMKKLLTGDWRIKPEILNKYKEA
jgi:type I restriction enzyme S subunit